MATTNNNDRRMSVIFSTVEEVKEVEKAVEKINEKNKKDSFGNVLSKSRFIKDTTLQEARRINSGKYKFANSKK